MSNCWIARKFQSAVESLHRPELLSATCAGRRQSPRGDFPPGVATLYGQCEDLDCDVTFNQALVPQIAVSDGVDLGAWIEFSLQDSPESAPRMRTATPAALDSALPIFLTLPEAGSLGPKHR